MNFHKHLQIMHSNHLKDASNKIFSLWETFIHNFAHMANYILSDFLSVLYFLIWHIYLDNNPLDVAMGQSASKVLWIVSREKYAGFLKP